MLGEEEEGQPHDAVELDHRAKHDDERCPEVALALYQREGEHDGSSHNDIELGHEQGIEQLVAAEPQDEQLLIPREIALAHRHIKTRTKKHQPAEQVNWPGHNGKRCHDE